MVGDDEMTEAALQERIQPIMWQGATGDSAEVLISCEVISAEDPNFPIVSSVSFVARLLFLSKAHVFSDFPTRECTLRALFKLEKLDKSMTCSLLRGVFTVFAIVVCDVVSFILCSSILDIESMV